MWMNVESRSVWDVRFGGNWNTAVGAWKKRWWHWGGRVSSICRNESPGVYIPFVRCFKVFDYEMTLRQVVASTQELVMSQIWSGIEIRRRVLFPCPGMPCWSSFLTHMWLAFLVARFHWPSCPSSTNVVVVLFPTTGKCAPNGRVSWVLTSFFVPVVGRHLVYALINIFIQHTVLPESGPHLRYCNEVIQPSCLSASKSVRRLVQCSLGQWCRIRMMLFHRTVEGCSETLASVASLIVWFRAMIVPSCTSCCFMVNFTSSIFLKRSIRYHVKVTQCFVQHVRAF